MSQSQASHQQSPTHSHTHNKLSRQQSVQDNEQQLRSLLGLVEQYHQHYSQMLDKHKETIRDTYSFEDFINKVKMNNESEVQLLYDGMKSMRKMLQEVLTKCMAILPEVIKECTDSKTKITTIMEQLDDKELVIQGLKDNKRQVQRHLAEITLMYDKSRYDYQELSEKINQKEQEFETESREIRKTFMEVTQSSEQEKKILQQMYESNEKLAIALHETKNEKMSVQKQLEKASQDLIRTRMKINALENQLGKREHKLKEYQAEIESIHMSRRKASKNSMESSNNNNSEDDPYLRESFTEHVEEKKADKIRLNEELTNYQIPSVKELNGSFIMGSGIKRSIGEESDYEYEEKRKENGHHNNNHTHNGNINISINGSKMEQQGRMESKKVYKQTIADPYFSHYILISQSVKIKQDCEDMLNIDMKPYYQEIIEKRIPMHLWDQWIKNRLRELLRQNYGTEA